MTGLSHFHPKLIFFLERLGVIHPEILELEDYILICASWKVGTDQIHAWRTKENYSRSTCRENYDEIGAGISDDQLQPTQPGLFPQFLGEVTRKQIPPTWIILDHYSNVVYANLMSIKIQE